MAEEVYDRRRQLSRPQHDSFEETNSPKHDIHRQTTLQLIRDKGQRLKNDFMGNQNEQLNDLFEELFNEIDRIQQSGSQNGEIKKAPRIEPVHVRKHEKGVLLDKEFVTRRSVLTELLEINHIRTIYHIFVAIMILFSLNTIGVDLMDTGRIALDFDMITWNFGKMPIVISIWLSMKMSTILVYPVFQYWAYNRRGKTGMQDYMWLSLYVAYQLAFLVVPVKSLNENALPPASAVIIMCEQVRLLMKSHAFVRSNIPRAINYKKKEGAPNRDNLPCPDFSKYLYFLFVPTLVYRDSYPRTSFIRWNYVASNFGQVLACLFYVYYIFARFCVPVFQTFGKEHVTPKRLLLGVFGSMLPGTLVLFIAFFAVLHSWFNAFAEMLRFGDRLFYKDWWNSTSFANYYRTWNVVVHDWLYTYVYIDACKMFGSSSRPMAMASVFLLSAIFHEYILSVTFGFFYPVLLVMFAGAGFGFIFLTDKGVSRSWNIFMWVSLFIGNGLLMCLYSMEWYARQNCPPFTDSVVDYFVPRSWICTPSGVPTHV